MEFKDSDFRNLGKRKSRELDWEDVWDKAVGGGFAVLCMVMLVALFKKAPILAWIWSLIIFGTAIFFWYAASRCRKKEKQ